ncbi:hypothetical protein LKL35_36015 [Streptomyces sp. ET3-23]|uniref:hypothetical protein n=1 Tax=Streptomyces sp. ET3-23 TaxID=2885643 RepID=UPI001D0F4CBA|nr:hypothetical protein [Streptomyces sp. ET3-23]MCC2280744.1 hypothetical protein [Streptomyces sp. ET3-23]
MAPGWTHRDGRVTPAGLLGSRTGRGAATDRLALLLVLQARETGRVRQCGGTVDTKRGRAAATVARLLGCTASAGERVLERLEGRGLVLRVRLQTGSGLAHRTRLMVPAVAAAHGRPGVDGTREEHATAPDPVFSDPDAAAGGCEAPAAETQSQVNGVPVADESDGAEPDVSAALHTDHPSLVSAVSRLPLSGGFSGEGRDGNCGRPGRACAGEAGSVALRAEKPTSSPLARHVARRVPRTARLLVEVVGEVSGYQRDRLERLVNGLLLDGESDEMIVARLRQRLARIATGDPARPYAFRRDGLSWALSVGLPYQPGGMTQVPCRNRWCRSLVLGRATDEVRCDDCELASYEADRRATAVDVPPPPAELARFATLTPAAPVHIPAQRAGSATESAGAAGEPAPGVPATVQEQLDLIAAVDPRTASLASEAALALYGPVPDGGAAVGSRRDRVSAAMAVFSAVTDRYAHVLAAHYSGSAA